MKIDWKEPSKALTKLYPREAGEDGDDIPAEAGSFFNFFELEADPFEVCRKHSYHAACQLILLPQIGLLIGNEVFPEAIDYFLAEVGMSGIPMTRKTTATTRRRSTLRSPR